MWTSVSPWSPKEGAAARAFDMVVAAQVDPMKPKLKPPEINRLKLNCDGPLSKFAFNFNLRRYSMVVAVLCEVSASGQGMAA